jgi:hypothetical protein
MTDPNEADRDGVSRDALAALAGIAPDPDAVRSLVDLAIDRDATDDGEDPRAEGE